jgi:glucose-1-phosphate thymidylyltransferase
MKGIVLAGGTGSRLWPITRSVSKQLLPVYDKPMIYYPISTLMLAGIREILIITTPHDQSQFKELLGDGSDLGVSFQYAQQPEPKGLAQAFTIGEDFLAGDSCLMILGDNIFQGTGLGRDLIRLIPKSGAHIFTYEVRNPSDYGVLIKDSKGLPMLVVEKPERFVSNLAVTGLYFFDSNVVNYARSIKPSNRGELEITSIIQMYIDDKKLTFTELSRGSAWLDTGSAKNLNDASNFVRVIEERTGLKIGCLEEIALAQGWIKSEKLSQTHSMNNEYSKYVRNLVKEKNNG